MSPVEWECADCSRTPTSHYYVREELPDTGGAGRFRSREVWLCAGCVRRHEHADHVLLRTQKEEK